MSSKLFTGFIATYFVYGLFSCSSKIEVATADNFEQIELPDSSIVYLNKNAKLSYNETFNPRTVELEGEAFFSVNEGETPFKVISSEGEEVTVLGTEFNLIMTSKNIFLEVEIGKVNILIGDRSNDIISGKRLVYGRHDNGLHLGQAKREHRSWIKVMSKDFNKAGRTLKRSYKHSNKALHKANTKGAKSLNKNIKPKGGGKIAPKNNKPNNKKSGSKTTSKSGQDKGNKSKKGKK